ncbi:hypothetical protein AX23_11975 [Brucella melitensis 548]|nr:hypothetical protein AX23_11975 [Brucella melitensis 548]
MSGDEGAKLLGQRLHTLLQCVTLIGECKLCASFTGGFCNAPSDRAIIGHA